MDFSKNVKTMKEILVHFWKKGLLLNGVIRTQDGCEFKVHMELMVTVSPHLNQLVYAASLELGSTPKEIHVPRISGDNMALVIEFVYTGKCEVSLDEVEGLIVTADILEIPSIVNLCVDYISNHINEYNCVSIYNFFKNYKSKQLLKKSRKYLLSNFEKIFRTNPDFLELEADDIQILIGSDELNITSEESAFHAVAEWAEHDPVVRRPYLPTLLGLIRFGFCSIPFYQQRVVAHPFIADTQDCQSILYQASMLFVEMNSTNEPRPIDLHHPLIRPRIPYSLLFVIGGWSNGSATNVIESFDPRASRWFMSVYTDNMPRAYHGLVSLEGVIYMIGGFDGNQCFNTVRCFDPQKHLWYEKACMYVPRCYVSVASVSGYIYAMGGYDGHVRVNSAEKYDKESNQWNMVANMHHVRSDASATSLDGKVFVAGGFNGQQVLSSAEVYDPITDEWTLIPEMSSPRSGVNLIAYNGAVYVVGGFNGTNRLNTVERFDPKVRQWTAVTPMSIPRSNFATATIEGRLFVIGGFNGLTTVPHVECYSSELNRWQPITDMNVNRSALSACVIDGLPNSQEYSFLGNSAVLLN